MENKEKFKQEVIYALNETNLFSEVHRKLSQAMVFANREDQMQHFTGFVPDPKAAIRTNLFDNIAKMLTSVIMKLVTDQLLDFIIDNFYDRLVKERDEKTV